MEGLPIRRHPRLKGHDYSSAGYYFVTICTKEKRCILGDVVGRGILDAPSVALTECGRAVDSTLEYLTAHAAEVVVDQYVIMPNHIHMILSVTDDGASGKPRPTKADPANAAVPKFISSLKRAANKKAGRPLWQTSFYDHIIRSEADYLRIWQYIDDNPAKWAEDEYYQA